MLKYWHIKKYGEHLASKLAKRYGEKDFYTASQIRATVYQCNYKPSYLPLGYLLYLDKANVEEVFANEFSDLCINEYKNDMLAYLNKKQYNGRLYELKHG